MIRISADGGKGSRVFSELPEPGSYAASDGLIAGATPEDIDDSCEQHAADALRYGTHPQAALVCGDEGVRGS